MGLIRNIFGGPKSIAGLGRAITDVAGAFVPNATQDMMLGHKAFGEVVSQYGAEYQGDALGVFDRFVNGLNRLPRPALALGTLGLFGFAMVSPEQFSLRMQGLEFVPEPLWWLLGAIVSFYFGAREMYHVRQKQEKAAGKPIADEGRSGNSALTDWRSER